MTLKDKKILYLILKKEFFNQIKSGEKTSEYRGYKPFWIKRLMNKDRSFKTFDLVHFRNGYHKDAPTMLFEIKGINIIKRKGNWFSTQKYFEIDLGQIIEIDI